MKFYNPNDKGSINAFFCFSNNKNTKPFRESVLTCGPCCENKYNTKTKIQMLKGHYSFGIIRNYKPWSKEYMIELTHTRRGVAYDKPIYIYAFEEDFKVI